MEINWNATQEEKRLIIRVAMRAAKVFDDGSFWDGLKTIMDLTAVHLNICELKLKELLEAREIDFMHDLLGIRNNLNRDTCEFMNNFLPRFKVGK